MFYLTVLITFHAIKTYLFLQRRDIIEVFPTLESPTNITLNAHVENPGFGFSKSTSVRSESIFATFSITQNGKDTIILH